MKDKKKPFLRLVRAEADETPDYSSMPFSLSNLPPFETTVVCCKCGHDFPETFFNSNCCQCPKCQGDKPWNVNTTTNP